MIAAPSNSTHGVAMRNFPFGGQTRIAYTQDPYLDALEVTEPLDRIGHSTMRFFNGTKAEYPRRMHCTAGIGRAPAGRGPAQPQAAGHRRTADRAAARRAHLREHREPCCAPSSLTACARPSRPDKVFDPLEVVREEGPTLVQSFHETAAERGGKLLAILADLCAFANTSGGAVYVGCKPGKLKIKGLADPAQTEKELRAAIEERFSPRLEVKYDVLQSQTAKVLRIQTLKGPDMPYALDDNKFYVRDEADTSLAVRDEIVALVREAFGLEREAEPEEGDLAMLPTPAVQRVRAAAAAGPAADDAARGAGGAQRPAVRAAGSPRCGRGRQGFQQ